MKNKLNLFSEIAESSEKRWFFWLVMLLTGLTMQGCYTLSQGYYQTRLLLKRESIVEVISEQSETPERLEKLKLVPVVLQFAREQIGLETGDSYTSYIRLDAEAVTWVVQAAQTRSLERKTWWFPIVGSQPYLGFFQKQDALHFQSELKDEGLDTRLGGVSAFSMLGFVSDPLYSSMIDSRSIADLVDLLIHECVHRTLYVPNASTFNESFADFIAKKATVLFLSMQTEGTAQVQRYTEAYRREVAAGQLFKPFLENAMTTLKEFYADALENADLKSDEAFLAARSELFKKIEMEYNGQVRDLVKETWYENAFRADRMNNAVILAYSLYEAQTEPFEKALSNANGDLVTLIQNLKGCLGEVRSKDEKLLWDIVSRCKGQE